MNKKETEEIENRLARVYDVGRFDGRQGSFQKDNTIEDVMNEIRAIIKTGVKK